MVRGTMEELLEVTGNMAQTCFGRRWFLVLLMEGPYPVVVLEFGLALGDVGVTHWHPDPS